MPISHWQSAKPRGARSRSSDIASHIARPKWRDDDAGAGYGATGLERHTIDVAAIALLAASHEDEAGALAYLANASNNLRRVAAAGVPIALGSDVNNPSVYPGYSAHEELAWMVRAGLYTSRRSAALSSSAPPRASAGLRQASKPTSCCCPVIRSTGSKTAAASSP